MDLSIAVINWNTEEFLSESLASICKYTKDIEREIIIVDNNSSDGSVNTARGQFPEAKIITNHVNLGFSRAVNQAIRVSSSEYIFISNPDIRIEENIFPRMIEYMVDNSKIAMLGPKLIDGQGRVELSFNQKCSDIKRCVLDNLFFYSLLRIWLFEKYFIKIMPPRLTDRLNKPQPVAWVAGAAFLLRKAAANDSGLMDEKFFLYSEDEDFGCRLNKAGWQVHYFPKASVRHLRNKSIAKYSGNLVLESSKSKLIYYRKRYNLPVIGLIKCLMFYRLTFELLVSYLFYVFIPYRKANKKYKLLNYIEALKALPTL